ncbi:MAG TPA: AsmA-like C-terminal region-containing protein, partial [Gemmataceae bacterium]
GREVRGSAEVSAPHGSLLGLDFADVRIPLSWTIFPLQQRGRVWTPEVRGRLGHGEVTGAAEFAWFAGAGARLEGDFRFRNIDANPLLRVFSPAASGAGGKARGRLTLSGTDVRSVNDLRGTLGASFSRLQVFQLPVLDRVAALLGPVRSAAVTADEASLRASLSRGVVRVHEFSAVSPAVQVFIAGSVGLNGRLDLEVIAHTGRLVLNPAWLRLAGIQVPVAVGPIPVAVLIEVSNFLSRRTVQLEVTGTVDTPIVRVKAIPLLSEQAVRFFLNRASIPIP